MAVTAPAVPPVLEAFAATYLRLFGQVRGSDVAEMQWRAGRTPVPKEDTTERSIGLTSDPVPTVTFDTRRVALRNAVIEAERSLREARRTLDEAEASLAAALERSAREASGPPGDR